MKTQASKMNRRELIKIFGMAPLASIAEPLNLLARKTAPSSADTFQLVIYGATPAGIACAVRAAREGLNVLLVHHSQRLGGMFINGLGIMDTLYNGSRSPMYDEFRQSIYQYYRQRYGTNSPQYQATGPGISKTKYEAYVAEELIKVWVAAEPGITVRKGYYPGSAGKTGDVIDHVAFRAMEGTGSFSAKADVFVDCSYEGDLAAIAGAPCRIGRESKEEYGEKHAGVIYTKDIDPKNATDPLDKDQAELIRNLNLYRYKETGTLIIQPGSTGEADSTIQGFNLRAIVTDDPGNKVLPGRPAHYDAGHFKEHYQHKAEKLTLSRPNNKSSLARPEILGLQNKYVEGDWAIRKSVIEQYKQELLGLFYFRQNDPSLPEEIRTHWRKYGFAKDEFPDNDHIPYELYIREARRIRGRAVFTEHDAQLSNGLKRAPLHEDSIGITEWFLDSHACTDRTIDDSKEEGEVMLKSETVPGQIPLGTLLPLTPRNLIVPVCLSASHIGLGALRLEPVWMQLGEASAYIAVEAVQAGIAPAEVNADILTRKLASKRFMLSFFNDVEGRESAPWYPAIQYLGARGFFGSYEAKPESKLTKALAEQWAEQVKYFREKKNWDANNHALKVAQLEEKNGEKIKAKFFAEMIDNAVRPAHQASSLMRTMGIAAATTISRGDAARLIFETLALPVK